MSTIKIFALAITTLAIATTPAAAKLADTDAAPRCAAGVPQEQMTIPYVKIEGPKVARDAGDGSGVDKAAPPKAKGHVKVFDGRTGAAHADDGATGEHIKKAQLHIRKAGDEPHAHVKPDGDTAPPRMQTQNNMKQMGLASTCK